LVEEHLTQERIIRREFSDIQKQENLYRLRKKFFGRYDDWLDGCEHGSRWLEDEKVAKSVIKS
jgi:putative transposase